MRKHTFSIFRYSAATLLVVSALGKFIGSGSGAAILAVRDPIFLLPFRYMLWMAGIMELIAVFLCLIAKRRGTQAAALAWLSTNLLLYRVGLWLIDYHRPCNCMGSLADGLHISPENADTAMKIVLAYLLMGSYVTLFWLWRQRKKATPVSA